MDFALFWERIWPVIKAGMPFIVAAALAAGLNISPELQFLLVNNIEALMLAIGGLAAAFPSLKAAVKHQEKAD